MAKPYKIKYYIFMKTNVFLVILIVILSNNFFYSQELFDNKDLKTIKIDNLQNDEIIRVKDKLIENNLTIEKAKSLLIQKGLALNEYDKLKTRIENLETENIQSNEFNKSSDNVKNDYSENSKDSIDKPNVKSLIFGSEIFNNKELNFEPSLNIATPLNYILGPGDELQISVFGIQEFNSLSKVSTEGKISIQHVGQIAVSGISIEAANQKIKNAISKVYTTVSTGQSQVAISLSKIKTIRVTIIGSNNPGNYSVSSLSTVFNALHLAKGPSENGSYRNIELIRNNKIIKTIDIYRFLLNGDQSDNIGLKENDVIRIPAYIHRVTIEGNVKIPGIFEMKNGETFQDLLNFASGFNSKAYTASVNVIQTTEKEYKVKDISSSEFSTYLPKPGDVINVSEILNRYENRIQINGAVFRPNSYAFYENMKISNLIKLADGLREDVYKDRAKIVRKKDDLTNEVININLKSVLSGDVDSDIQLKKEDIVTIYSILDFKEKFNVKIFGEINKPGEYEYIENQSLNDLIIEAGGLTGVASKKIEISRMIKSEDLDDTKTDKIEIFNFEINTESNEQVKNFDLKPFDVINIRKMAVVEVPQAVTIKGAVIYPGQYSLISKKERVYDVINRAGGLTLNANINGVKIKRPLSTEQLQELENIDFNFGDSSENNSVKKIKQDLKYLTIPIDWKKISKHPRNIANVLLVSGDEIEITNYKECVKISGNVILNSEIPYRKRKGLKYYVNSVGGKDEKAWFKKTYIIYPNGKADCTNSFLFFKFFPKVQPGCQIVVPEKFENKKRASTSEIIGLGSMVASLSGVIIAILKL